MARLPQLAGHEARNPLIFLTPTGRHHTTADGQRVAARHEGSRGAEFRQGHAELVQHELVFIPWLSVAQQFKVLAVGGRQMHVPHLDRAARLDEGARGHPADMRAVACIFKRAIE